MPKLCEFELKVLREAAGQPQSDLVDGAALWAALGFLRRARLVDLVTEDLTLVYRATPAGLALLAEADHA